MQETLIASVAFWLTFIFTIGPFWATVMAVAKNSTLGKLYQDYLIYLLLGWLPQIVVIGVLMTWFGGMNERLLTLLYFVGAGVMLYFAWRIVVSEQNKMQTFDFNWRKMLILSWTNPKVWLTVPTGFLVANYTQNMWINIVIFYGISVLLFMPGFYIWAMVGRQSAKIAKGKISYINALLLVGFALYLCYQGVLLI